MMRALEQAINLACAALIAFVVVGDRDALTAVMSYIVPNAPKPVEPSTTGSLTLRADARGHFLVVAEVDGKPIRFLVDSGASNIMLSRRDADTLELGPERLIFTQMYSTPGGIVRAAPVQLREVRIGALRLRNVQASVSERPMDVSLLGASFLARLKGYEVSGGRMTLRW
jgi:aspartyl protease family protein